MNTAVIIVGGGLAGLTAAICLAKKGVAVRLIEKQAYPRHKVCGEYVSNEVRPFLEELGLDLEALGAIGITQFSFSGTTGVQRSCALPLGGFGISRYALDHALYQLALKNGVEVMQDTVTAVVREGVSFLVSGKKQSYHGQLVLGAYGKRSGLDKALERSFIKGRSPFLAVKGHYKCANFNASEVALHSFPGGYAGLSMVEGGLVNFCYLASYHQFSAYGDIANFNAKVVATNPFLGAFLENSEPVFSNPLSIAQISFAKKEKTHNGMLLCGDSAGLIHPLCGNGMAMAIHAGKIAASLGVKYLHQKNYNLVALQKEYTALWNKHFKFRLAAGRSIQSLVNNPFCVNTALRFMPSPATIMGGIIKQTHGKPILV